MDDIFTYIHPMIIFTNFIQICMSQYIFKQSHPSNYYVFDLIIPIHSPMNIKLLSDCIDMVYHMPAEKCNDILKETIIYNLIQSLIHILNVHDTITKHYHIHHTYTFLPVNWKNRVDDSLSSIRKICINYLKTLSVESLLYQLICHLLCNYMYILFDTVQDRLHFINYELINTIKLNKEILKKIHELTRTDPTHINFLLSNENYSFHYSKSLEIICDNLEQNSYIINICRSSEMNYDMLSTITEYNENLFELFRLFILLSQFKQQCVPSFSYDN